MHLLLDYYPVQKKTQTGAASDSVGTVGAEDAIAQEWEDTP